MEIYLAGTSSLRERPDLLQKSMYTLESFLYVREWQMPYLLGAKGFILDSGAFSFMSQNKKTDLFGYARKYAKFIKEFDIENYIELDVESVTGWDDYKRINDVIDGITKKRGIPVFHKTRGMEWWEQTTRQFGRVAYGGVAIAGGRNRKIDYDVMPEFIKIAHKNGAVVHGLGFTQTKKFDRIRFDSVDSTTWTVAGRLGAMCFFTGTRMVQFHSTEKGKKMRNPKELAYFNFDQWIKYQRYAEEWL